MSWKNYFYFQRGDKIAILTLLILIVISGIIYLATTPSHDKDTSYAKTKLAEEFNHFQSQLIEKKTNTKEGKIYKDENSAGNNIQYPYQEKLKQGQKIDLNKADTTELKKIPGIGSTFANRIVKYRYSLGGFVNIDQLKEVWGMDENRFSKIVPYITIEGRVSKIKINTATFQDLNRHPYIASQQAKIILDIRERKGKIESANRLYMLEEFSKADVEKLSPYLDFD